MRPPREIDAHLAIARVTHLISSKRRLKSDATMRKTICHKPAG